ncbi:MAG: hypothetical protein ABSA93_29170 [Streptosporangiaceae bacterium]
MGAVFQRPGLDPAAAAVTSGDPEQVVRGGVDHRGPAAGADLQVIAALTTSQITSHGDSEDVTIQLGQHNIPVPAPQATDHARRRRQALRRHRNAPGPEMAVLGTTARKADG